jgi:hypothetical protein
MREIPLTNLANTTPAVAVKLPCASCHLEYKWQFSLLPWVC